MVSPTASLLPLLLILSKSGLTKSCLNFRRQSLKWLKCHWVWWFLDAKTCHRHVRATSSQSIRCHGTPPNWLVSIFVHLKTENEANHEWLSGSSSEALVSAPRTEDPNPRPRIALILLKTKIIALVYSKIKENKLAFAFWNRWSFSSTCPDKQRHTLFYKLYAKKHRLMECAKYVMAMVGNNSHLKV